MRKEKRKIRKFVRGGNKKYSLKEKYEHGQLIKKYKSEYEATLYYFTTTPLYSSLFYSTLLYYFNTNRYPLRLYYFYCKH